MRASISTSTSFLRRYGHLVMLGATTLTTLGFVGATASCLTDACADSEVKFGATPGEGSLVDENTWQSTPLDGQWIPYPHHRTYVFNFGGKFRGRRPSAAYVYISANDKPNDFGSNFTLAGGDTATIGLLNEDGMYLRNNTCADYYVRVLVEMEPVKASPDAGASDAAGDTDAPSDGAAREAGADGG